MSDTPLTDELDHVVGNTRELMLLGHARGLERELSAARAEVERLKDRLSCELCDREMSLPDCPVPICNVCWNEGIIKLRQRNEELTALLREARSELHTLAAPAYDRLVERIDRALGEDKP